MVAFAKYNFFRRGLHKLEDSKNKLSKKNTLHIAIQFMHLRYFCLEFHFLTAMRRTNYKMML